MTKKEFTLDALKQALPSLEDGLKSPPRNSLERDGVIQRFDLRKAVKMKPFYKILLILVLATVNLSMKFIDPSDILSDEDLNIERTLSQHSVISEPDGPMESFLKWSCFSARELVKTACVDDEGLYPSLYYGEVAFEWNDQIFHFDLGEEMDGDECLARIAQFKRFGSA